MNCFQHFQGRPYHRVGRPYVGMARTCNTNGSLLLKQYMVVRLYGYLTFILECSVTTKTVKVASKHRGSTKMELILSKLFIFFFLLLFQMGYLNTAVRTHRNFSTNRQHLLACRSIRKPRGAIAFCLFPF